MIAVMMDWSTAEKIPNHQHLLNTDDGTGNLAKVVYDNRRYRQQLNNNYNNNNSQLSS